MPDPDGIPKHSSYGAASISDLQSRSWIGRTVFKAPVRGIDKGGYRMVGIGGTWI